MGLGTFFAFLRRNQAAYLSRPARVLGREPAVEVLEGRRLLSASAFAVAPPAGGGTGGAVTAAAVKTAGETFHATAGVPRTGDVGVVTGLTGVASDFRNLRATIDWGDGSPATDGAFAKDARGRIHVIGAHAYAASGDYAVTVDVSKGPIVPPGQPNRFHAVHVATIHSKAVVAPGANSVGGVTIRETAGRAFTAKVGSFNAIAPATGLQAVIDWGDGHTSAGTLKATGGIAVDLIQFDVLGAHTYAKAGTYAIHVVVSQNLGPAGSKAPVRLVAEIHSTAVVGTKAAGPSLDGAVSGTYQTPVSIPDVGLTYDFTGAGDAGSLGHVTTTGSVHLPGFVASGRATGSLNLANAKGSVTLALTGPTEPGFGPFPSTLTYVVTGGTGTYAGAAGSGTITATLVPGDLTGRFTFVLHSA